MMHMNNNRRTQWPHRYNKTPSKVVSIPVHFIDSSQSQHRSDSSSSLKIQSVFRGFLVRKSMKKMLIIKVELEEIEKKVNDSKTMELMRREQKEKIRVGETIMNLLLRLDSVRVFSFSALRDLRKLLIKRAIVLQELVDQIQVVGPTTHDLRSTQVEGGKKIEGLVSEEKNESFEGKCVEEYEGGNKIEGSVNGEKNENCEGGCVEEEDDCLVKENEGDEQEGSIKIEALMEEEKNENCEEQNEGEEKEGGIKIEALMKEEKNENCVEEEGNCLVKENEGEEQEGGNKIEALMKEEKNEDGEGKCVLQEDNCLVKENEGDEEQEGGNKIEALMNEKEKEGQDEDLEQEGGNKMETLMEKEEEDGEVKCVGGESLVKEEESEKMEVLVKMEDGEDGEDGCEEEEEEGGRGGNGGENREMLKKMVEDNEKMMDMMAQLFERNEMQTRMLTSLTQRVEQLERAFTCEKLRSKKKQKRRNLDAKCNRQIDPKN